MCNCNDLATFIDFVNNGHWSVFIAGWCMLSLFAAGIVKTLMK